MKKIQSFQPWRPHPWHGLPLGDSPPMLVNAYIEITPFDVIKYEIDKTTGYVRVERPQRTSSLPPCLYGFIPRTYCGDRVAAMSRGARTGDGDPLDICVLSERPINRAEIIIPARVVGVLRTIDHREADDKIIAVLENDPLWGGIRDVGELPESLVVRLHHYFSTYKSLPNEPNAVHVEGLENRASALRVIEAASKDYEGLVKLRSKS
jgi:inorganic pyrophosphatase